MEDQDVQEAESAVQPQEHHAPEAQQSDKEINFARLREQNDHLSQELRSQAAELEALKAYLEQTAAKSSQYQETSDELGIADDDYVEGKDLKAVRKELQALKKYHEDQKVRVAEDRLRSRYPDLETVITPENLKKLKKTEPELYAQINNMDDLYARGVSAYKFIKAYAMEPGYEDEQRRIQQNMTKPMSSQSVKGQSPLAEANRFAEGLTPELKIQLQKEMQAAIRNG